MTTYVFLIRRGDIYAGFPVDWVSDSSHQLLAFDTRALARTYVEKNKLKSVEIVRRLRNRKILKDKAPKVRGPRSIYQAWYPEMMP